MIILWGFAIVSVMLFCFLTEEKSIVVNEHFEKLHGPENYECPSTYRYGNNILTNTYYCVNWYFKHLKQIDVDIKLWMCQDRSCIKIWRHDIPDRVYSLSYAKAAKLAQDFISTRECCEELFGIKSLFEEDI